MAFASTKVGEFLLGDAWLHHGTFTNGATDTGGDIDTKFKRVEVFWVIQKGSAVVADAPVANETFPLAGGSVTIVTTANADGYWYAIGVR